MSTGIVLLISILYVLFLFLIASYAEKRALSGNSIINNPYVYSLSLGVYCTAWTFFGSVGRAATTGLGFLPIYLGPTLVAPFWFLILRKMIHICKSQRITSIADFISSRYGKSTNLGILATLIAVLGIIPYISIQLKAISLSYEILATEEDFIGLWLDNSSFYRDKTLMITIILAVFTLLFGSRKLDPNERHEGLVASIAFESIIKLTAFFAVGIYVTYGIYSGFADVFQLAYEEEKLRQLFTLESSAINNTSWLSLIILSMSAILFLPRQFHIAVVENTNVNFVWKASWLFPLYLFLICLFVIPVAFGGVLHFPFDSVEPDSFILNLPMFYDNKLLALFVFIGGLSAASSMVIVSVIALSIMISNNLIMPFLLQSSVIKERYVKDVSKRLLGIRRVSMVVVLLLAYGYFKSVGKDYSLVSIGLISFTAVAQFAPVIIGGLYWKRGTKAGAIVALLVGFIIWVYTLPLPTLAETSMISDNFIKNGLFGISFLKPYALFGLEGFDQISHAAFWSLLFNLTTYIFVSLNTQQGQLEITQADLFVDIYKYGDTISEYEVIKRKARLKDIIVLMDRFIGKERANSLLKKYEKKHSLDFTTQITANADLVNYAEKHISGSLGAASAKVVIGSIVKEEPISLEEMLKILDQTQEVLQYSKQLETKSIELKATTIQLKQANEQLKELDRLKANFITTVTHELRTPITSMKALSKILLDNPTLPHDQQSEFLAIVVSESERITRLINQVLDLEKIQSLQTTWEVEKTSLAEVIEIAIQGFTQSIRFKNIDLSLAVSSKPIFVNGNKDRLVQVLINLIANAIRFVPTENGKIIIYLSTKNNQAILKVKDNGIGISEKDQRNIFDQFTQISDVKLGKPKGSGLGLHISKKIIEQHEGTIAVKSKKGNGAIFLIVLPVY